MKRHLVRCIADAFVLSLSFWTGFSSQAAVWYVDGSIETDGYDGQAEAYDASTGHGPKKYIQSAVALATISYNNAGDHDQHVIVLPGVYDSGENYPSDCSAANACASRVVISRPLTLTAKGGKTQTAIVGRYGTVADADKEAPIKASFENLGTNAVRCIYVSEAAAGTVIEGFTLRDGATWYNYDSTQTTETKMAETGVKYEKHYGGGICARASDVYVCDCDIRDCWGFYAGLMYNGTAARTKFESGTVGWKNTAAIFGTRLSNCLLLRNGQTTTPKTYLLRNAAYVVNCTFVGNQMTFMHVGNCSTNYNGLCWANNKEGATDTTTQHFAFRSVYSKAESAVKLAGGADTCLFGASADTFYSSGTDDYRLMADSPAIGFGSYQDLADLTADLPERYRLKDYLGQAIVADDAGKINCGAIQAVVQDEDLTSGTLKIATANFDAFGGRDLVYSASPYDTLQIRGASGAYVSLNASRCAAEDCYFHTTRAAAAFPDAATNFVFALPPVGTTETLEVATETATFGKMTVTAVDSGFTVSVSDTTRPFRGYRVDGVLDALPWSMSVASTELLGHCIEPVYTTDWYVNPAGSDSNNGMTPTRAMKTLKAALENASLQAGDTVHAAAGIYSEGETSVEFTESVYLKDPDGVCDLPSRAVVPVGVTLLADEGPEKTFIVGHAATDSSATLGLGDGAVRCVLLRSGTSADQRAVVDGFTLTGGRTQNKLNGKSSYRDSDNAGGGVASDKIGASNAGIVRNCILSNCCARIGGGSFGARLVNTRVFDVDAVARVSSSDICGGAAAFFGYFSGCAFDGISTDDCVLRNFRTDIIGCTFGPHLFAADGSTLKTTIGTPNASGVQFCNNLVRIKNTYSSYFATLANCVLAEGSSTNNAGSVSDCVILSANDMALLVDDENRPIAGTADETVSKGGDLAVYDWTLCGGVDAAGQARLSNGSLSIGAYQADWRAHYARILCGGRAKVSVTDVSTNVTWTYGDTFLRLRPGATLSVKAKTVPAKAGSLTEDLSGGASLSVLDGDVAVTPTDHVYRIFANGNDAVSIACSGEDGTYADIHSLTMARRGLTLLIR